MTEGAPPPQPPQPPTDAPTTPEPAAAPGEYPIGYEVDYAVERNRLTTFFRPIVAIPWAIVGLVYGIVGLVLAVAAWVALLVTGRYPRALYEWNSGILRFTARFNGFLHLTTDAWPPFGWGEEPNQPQRVSIAPRAESQSRLKVFFRLILALPLLVVAYAIGYLLEGAAIGSWLTIVFRGYQPRWLQNAIVLALRWEIRVGAYIGLLTDVYPPVGDEAPALAAKTA